MQGGAGADDLGSSNLRKVRARTALTTTTAATTAVTPRAAQVSGTYETSQQVGPAGGGVDHRPSALQRWAPGRASRIRTMFAARAQLQLEVTILPGEVRAVRLAAWLGAGVTNRSVVASPSGLSDEAAAAEFGGEGAHNS